MSDRPESGYTASETRAYRIQMLVAFISVTAIAGTRPTTTYRALDLGADTFQIGLVQSAFSVLPALTAVALGRYIDRHGAGRPYTVSLLILAAGGILSALAQDLLTLGIAQSILGFGGIGAFVSGQAMVISRSRRSDWNKRYGTYAAALSLGQLVGPSLAANIQSLPGLGHDSERVVFVGGAMLALAAAGLTALIPPGRAPAPQSEESEGKFGATVRRVLSRPGMLVAMFVSVSVASTIDVLAAYLPVYGEVSGLSVQFVGLLLSMRAGATIVSRIGMERLLKRFGWGRTLVGCLAISSAMLALLPTTAFPVFLLAIIAMLGLAIGLTQPMTITWVANQAPRAERGTALAVRLTGNRASLLFVPATMGAIAGSAGVAAVFWFLALALGLGAVVSRTAGLDSSRVAGAGGAPAGDAGSAPTGGSATPAEGAVAGSASTGSGPAASGTSPAPTEVAVAGATSGGAGSRETAG
jgi:MFS family permease